MLQVPYTDDRINEWRHNMQYTKNSLSCVIFRIDFLNPFNVEDELLDKSCMDIYPVKQNETVNEHNVKTVFNEKGEMAVERNDTTYINKKYSNRTLTRLITVSPKCVLTKVTDYTSYDDIRTTFTRVFDAIRKSNPEAIISRIGMRYINQIDLSNHKRNTWKNYIKPALFESVYNSSIESALQSKTQHLTELIIDDYRVRCVTGLFNPDYPAAIKRNVITLDYDAFIQGNVDASDAVQYLDKFHNTIEKLYEDSIGAKQREQMGIIEEYD